MICFLRCVVLHVYNIKKQNTIYLSTINAIYNAKNVLLEDILMRVCEII